MSLIDRIVDTYSQSSENQFIFEIDQQVRVLSTLDVDTYYIKDLLGQKGTVEKRYTTGLHKENKYEVRFESGRIEPFDEEELDKRFMKRRK